VRHFDQVFSLRRIAADNCGLTENPTAVSVIRACDRQPMRVSAVPQRQRRDSNIW
jgi:hypothetical protein